MKFSKKGTIITLLISTFLSVIFLFVMMGINVKKLHTVADLFESMVIDSMDGRSSVSRKIENSKELFTSLGLEALSTIGYEYQISYSNAGQNTILATSANYGTGFTINRSFLTDGIDWKVSVYMSVMDLFNITTVILFFLAVQGIGFVIIAPSQSEKKTREILYDITYKDHLTGAFNSKRLMRFFTARKTDNNAAFSMFYTDINNFHALNEKYGRHMGDEILKLFTGRLSSYVRDAIVVRLDADDFVVVIAGEFSQEILKSIQERLNNAFAKPLVVNDHDIVVPVAVAYTSFPSEGQTMEKLLSLSVERVKEIKKGLT